MRIEEYLKASPVFSINRAQEDIARNLRSLFIKEEVSFLEALVLLALFFETPTPVTPSTLARVFRTSRGNMSHCLSYLNSIGLAKRRMRSKDARSYEIHLTEAGQERAIRLIKLFDQLQIDIEKKVGKAKLDDFNQTISEVTSSLIYFPSQNYSTIRTTKGGRK
jgi:DNA-binding MarR family transcriptional regulator